MLKYIFILIFVASCNSEKIETKVCMVTPIGEGMVLMTCTPVDEHRNQRKGLLEL